MTSKTSFFSGFLKEGCELINEALNLFNNVYGAMHVEICACLRLLARLNYIMGDHPEVWTDANFVAALLGSFWNNAHVCIHRLLAISRRLF